MFPIKLTNMKNIQIFAALSALLVASWPQAAAAQSFAAIGSRAAGMGGAFVAVADDATAIYWNPAGLASGSFFSLTLDGTAGDAAPQDRLTGQEDSSLFLGLTMPALGLGYYRLKTTTLTPPSVRLVPAESSPSSRHLSVVGESRLDTLVTHHAGVTLVQSLWAGVAVGTTLKLVRGVAGSATVPTDTAEKIFDRDLALIGNAANRFDLDVGVMATGGPLRAGLTVRNVTEPGFAVSDGGNDLRLERQVRAGVAYAITPGWTGAADLDLVRTRDAFGERRDLAVGVEGRPLRRMHVRSGVTVNTAEADGDASGRRRLSVGGSYAVRSAVLVDAHFATGNDLAGHQWGIAARFVY